MHRGAANPWAVTWTPDGNEIWRTAPYLHNGSTASLKEVLTKKNFGDCHGKTSGLSEDEVNDLV